MRSPRSGKKSAPHGVIVEPDGAPWFTDGGQNAIVRVDPATTKQVNCSGSALATLLPGSLQVNGPYAQFGAR